MMKPLITMNPGVEVDPSTRTQIQIDQDYSDAISRGKNVLLDHCWATPITLVGGVLTLAAANEIRKKNYGLAAGYATGAALADLLDGLAARYYAKRHPEKAAERKNRGALEDQALDRFRNIVLGLASLSIEQLPRPVKRVIGGVIIKETVAVGVGAKAIIDHRREYGSGFPVPLPSSPIGKETMWEFGAGFGAALLSAKVKDTAPDLSSKLDATAATFIGIGIGRGLQTLPEYARANREMKEMTLEEQTNYKPEFYKPHIGTYAARFGRQVMNSVRYVNNTIEDNMRPSQVG